MKVILLAAVMLLTFTAARSQVEETRYLAPGAESSEIAVSRVEIAEPLTTRAFRLNDRPEAFPEPTRSFERLAKQKLTAPGKPENDDCCEDSADSDDDGDKYAPKEKFQWKPALLQSLIFIGFQHSYRVIRQEKTREGWDGKFFKDWGRSIKNIRGWRDGDPWETNYIAHPLQGAFTGRIFVNNSDRAKKQEFGGSKEYWQSRAKAMAWSAVWSVQFEIGPLSEATIGKVGLKKVNGYSSMAYGDFVVTPVVGTAVLVGEDAIDKYVLKNWVESKSSNKVKIALLRCFLTPTTSIGNLIRFKPPWRRDDRSL